MWQFWHEWCGLKCSSVLQPSKSKSNITTETVKSCRCCGRTAYRVESLKEGLLRTKTFDCWWMRRFFTATGYTFGGGMKLWAPNPSSSYTGQNFPASFSSHCPTLLQLHFFLYSFFPPILPSSTSGASTRPFSETTFHLTSSQFFWLIVLRIKARTIHDYDTRHLLLYLIPNIYPQYECF
ncbi:hypothetical protein BDD12DRAFT_106029 [Trichophaea hybrida]|nr:hypothetical protein BDD12DRAFT_106029 [Trichophaea hybrida]